MVINAAGLENGLRNKRDGYTFFGEKSHKVNFNFLNQRELILLTILWLITKWMRIRIIYSILYFEEVFFIRNKFRRSEILHQKQ